MMYQPNNPAPDRNRGDTGQEKGRERGTSERELQRLERERDFRSLTRFLKLLPDFQPEDFKALTFDPGMVVLEQCRRAFSHRSHAIFEDLDDLRVASGGRKTLPALLVTSIQEAEVKKGWSLLQACIKSNNLALFQHAIECGYPLTWEPSYKVPSIDEKQVPARGSLLHYAALLGRSDHALSLIGAKMPIEGRDSSDHTPLSLCGQEFLKRSLEIKTTDERRHLAIIADIFESSDMARELLRAGADPLKGPTRGESFAYSYVRWIAFQKHRFPPQEEVGRQLESKLSKGPRRAVFSLESPFKQTLEFAEMIGASGKILEANDLTAKDFTKLFNAMIRSGASFSMISDVIDSLLEIRSYQGMVEPNRSQFATILAPHMRELLYEMPEEVAGLVARVMDLALLRANINPFEAELFTFMSHQTGGRSPELAAAVSLAVTSTHDFYNKGQKKGSWEHLRQWELIGARNFQHAPLKLDSMSIIPGANGTRTSMLQQFGFQPLKCGKLGNGFAFKTSDTEYVEFLRGGFVAVKKGVGTLFVRNSSPSFDMRQILASPAYISKKDYWDLVEHEAGKRSIGELVLTERPDFAQIMEYKLYTSGHFLGRLAKLNSTLSIALRKYHQWKCVTAHDSVWSSEKDRTLASDALYGSAGFKVVSRFIRAWREDERGPLDLAWHDPIRPAFVASPYVGTDGQQKSRLRVDSRIAQGLYRLAADPKRFEWTEFPDLRSFFQGGIDSHGNLTLLNGTV